MTNLTCTIEHDVADAVVRGKLWSIYSRAFTKAKNECIQDQSCYTPELFEATLRDADYVKFIVWENGEPIGLTLSTNNLEKARIAYVNPRRFERDYPDHAGRIYYFTVLAVAPEKQNCGGTSLILEEVAAFIERNGALIAFDCASETNGGLPALFQKGLEAGQRKRGLSTSRAEPKHLGGQNYYVIKLS